MKRLLAVALILAASVAHAELLTGGAAAPVPTATAVPTATPANPAYETFQEEGSDLTQRRKVNRISAYETCVDNAGSARTDCTVVTPTPIPAVATATPQPTATLVPTATPQTNVSGKLFWQRSANQLIPPTSNYAAFSTRNDHAIVQFDASTDQCMYGEGFLPTTYGGGGIVFKLVWMGATATTGASGWQTSVERETTDLDSDSFASANSASTTTSSTSGIPNVTTITHTNSEIDGLSAGEPFRFKFCRDADGSAVTDDMSGLADLLGVAAYEP